jgi:bacteriocin-type signal sequence domain protein
MRSLLKVAVLSILLVIGLNAKDLLDLATNGTVNNSGIKALNDNEMRDVKGGYAFGRYAEFDFGGSGTLPSYAFLVADDEGYIEPINKEVGLPNTQVLVAKLRIINGRKETYSQIYDLNTRQKIRDYLNNERGDNILRDFNKYLRNNYGL